MLEREKFLGDKLAELLVYDVLFGMGVRGKFKGTMKRNYDSLCETLGHYMKKYKTEKKEDLLKLFEDESVKIKKPKYIFLNTLLHSKKEILEKLKADKFTRIKISNTTDENEDVETFQFDLKLVLKELKNFQFIKDNIVKNMLIFSPDSLLNKSHSLFENGHLMQIDKVRFNELIIFNYLFLNLFLNLSQVV
jgi:hypothetical protein